MGTAHQRGGILPSMPISPHALTYLVNDRDLERLWIDRRWFCDASTFIHEHIR